MPQQLGDRLWSALLTPAFHCLRLCPPRLASDTGERLGLRFGRSRSPLSTIAARENLRRIRPEMPEARLDAAIDRMWGNTGRLQAETAVIDRMWDRARIEVHGTEHVARALRSRRPLVFVFPHLGNWELLAIAAQRLGVMLNVVYELLPDRFELELALKARARLGYRLIRPDRRGTREMLAALGRGEAVGLAIDEFKDGNVIAPPFGRPPRSDTNARFAAKLSRRFGAPVIPAYCARTAPFAFSLRFLEPLEQPGAEALDALCEGWIREHAEQWYMLPRLRF